MMAVAAVIFALLGVGCAGRKPAVTPAAITTFVGERGGREYKTVKIGNQTWFAENLNNDGGGKCYKNDSSNCEKYGRLYTWDEAKGACPAGWHLPGDAEWTALEKAVGGSETAGKKLKSKTGWAENGNGTDEYGFSVLPGGAGYSGGNFDYAGDCGRWWSATESYASRAWGRYVNYDDEDVLRASDDKMYLFSVRCLAD